MSRADETSRLARWRAQLDWPQVVLFALAVVLVLSLIVAASTSSSAFGSYNTAWDGATDLRGMATDSGADAQVVTNVSAYPTADANGTVAVVLAPQEPYTDAETERLRAFVENGGTLVVAEDFGEPGGTLLAGLGTSMRVTGVSLRDERYYYQGPALPEARNTTPELRQAGVESVTLNHPSTLRAGDGEVLVRSSEYAYVDQNRNEELDDNESLAARPIVARQSLGAGQVIAVSDPSLFLNAMLDRPGNTAFVAWLFADSETVLLDYSHAGGQPPLIALLSWLRGSPLAQVSLGVVGLAGILAWDRRFHAVVTGILRRGRNGTDNE
jgi:hypothetical protein